MPLQLKSLKEKALSKRTRFSFEISADKINSAKTFLEFDNIVTAPLYGYKNAYDYWEQNSSLKYISAITIPTLILNALNDHFLTSDCHPVEEARHHKHVKLELSETGGHVGYCMDTPNGNYYSERRAIEFLNE